MGNLEKYSVSAYVTYLKKEERSKSTIEQYERNVRRFLWYLREQQLKKEKGEVEESVLTVIKEQMGAEEVDAVVTKEWIMQYKEQLKKQYKFTTINVILASINGFLRFIGRPELTIRLLKIQRQIYRREEKELSLQEYQRLLDAAEKQKDDRLAILLQTLGGVGIRVSELQYITAEAVEEGQVSISLKGKERVILLAGKLRTCLKEYMEENEIKTGAIFTTRTGKPLHRSTIWKMLKKLGQTAGVELGKVFPHNLRHLFARSFYQLEKDIVKLADLLGHSSINTTRIYTKSTGEEHRRQMDALGLVR